MLLFLHEWWTKQISMHFGIRNFIFNNIWNTVSIKKVGWSGQNFVWAYPRKFAIRVSSDPKKNARVLLLQSVKKEKNKGHKKVIFLKSEDFTENDCWVITIVFIIFSRLWWRLVFRVEHRLKWIIIAPTKIHSPKWRLCRKVEKDSSFKMLYQLLRINSFLCILKTRRLYFTDYPRTNAIAIQNHLKKKTIRYMII